jgi:hypothetical protein
MNRLSARAVAALLYMLCGIAIRPAPAETLEPHASAYAFATKDCRAALEKAEALAARGKWKSAFAALDGFDKANTDPYALAMKTSLARRGAVSSAAYRSFGFVDLEEGQDLETLREDGVGRDETPFDPPALAEAQAAKGVAAPGILSKELGEYYYEVLVRFSGEWSLSDGEIAAKAILEYSKAERAGAMDGESLLKYSSVLVYSDKKAEALREIDASIAAYGESEDRVNAIALGARIASRLGDSAREEGYYALADKGFPKSPTPGILRHMIAVEAGRKEAAQAVAEALVASYGSNPNVLRAIVSSWIASGERATARSFLQGSIAKGGGDGTLGALNFYLAVLLAQGDPSDEDKAAALAALAAAASHFKASVGADSEVYRVMDYMRESLMSGSADKPGE